MSTMRSLATLLAAAAAVLMGTAPALAAPSPPAEKIELTKMTGRWYEVARMPNKTQKDCQGGTSDWVRSGEGYSVVQACHKGALTAPATEWKAKAKVIDPKTNARIKMSFFGGMLSQEYWVLAHKSDWLILGTPNGNYMWLMSQRPTLSAQAKAQAVARVKQLGYDVSRLEYPTPARN
jgi:apolipoprotein D and lipocalin family protein